MRNKILYTDCIMNKNPGNRGGWTICSEEGLVKTYRFKGKDLTNNQLELMGIIDGLIHVEEFGQVITDSQFCTKTLDGEYNVSKKNVLGGLFELAKSIMIKKKVKVIWKPREENLAGIYNEKNKIEYKDKKSRKPIEKTLGIGIDAPI